jgi:hypothetical protein
VPRSNFLSASAKSQFDGLLAAHLAQAKLAWATGTITATGTAALKK